MGSKKSKLEVPIGVKIISIIYYLFAGFCVFSALFILIGGATLGLDTIPLLGTLFLALRSVMAIFLIATAVLEFFIARGLWKGQSWARVLVIIFSMFGLLFSLIGLAGGAYLQGTMGLVVNGFIGGYLLFSKESKSHFKK